MGGYRILVIEDDKNLQELLKFKLKDAGFKVYTADDGIKGLNMARTKDPDLILLDLLLPGMHGFDVLKELKRDKRTEFIKVYILSNLGQEDDVEKGLRLGADRYMIKADLTLTDAVAIISQAFE